MNPTTRLALRKRHSTHREYHIQQTYLIMESVSKGSGSTFFDQSSENLHSQRICFREMRLKGGSNRDLEVILRRVLLHPRLYSQRSKESIIGRASTKADRHTSLTMAIGVGTIGNKVAGGWRANEATGTLLSRLRLMILPRLHLEKQ